MGLDGARCAGKAGILGPDDAGPVRPLFVDVMPGSVGLSSERRRHQSRPRLSRRARDGTKASWGRGAEMQVKANEDCVKNAKVGGMRE